MTADTLRQIRPTVQGNAVYHARVLCTEIPDAVRLSCEDDRIRVDVPEADFNIVISPGQHANSRLIFEAVFRESSPYGRTWWGSWDLEVGAPAWAPAIGHAVLSEIRASRSKFGSIRGAGHHPEPQPPSGAMNVTGHPAVLR